MSTTTMCSMCFTPRCCLDTFHALYDAVAFFFVGEALTSAQSLSSFYPSGPMHHVNAYCEDAALRVSLVADTSTSAGLLTIGDFCPLRTCLLLLLLLLLLLFHFLDALST